VPVKRRVAKGRHPQFSAEVLALFLKLERKGGHAFTDGTRELARLLGLIPEWWTGNHVNDRGPHPCRPPSYIANADFERCRAVREALLAAVAGESK
jgi:hypothetical protein